MIRDGDQRGVPLLMCVVVSPNTGCMHELTSMVYLEGGGQIHNLGLWVYHANKAQIMTPATPSGTCQMPSTTAGFPLLLCCLSDPSLPSHSCACLQKVHQEAQRRSLPAYQLGSHQQGPVSYTVDRCCFLHSGPFTALPLPHIYWRHSFP